MPTLKPLVLFTPFGGEKLCGDGQNSVAERIVEFGPPLGENEGVVEKREAASWRREQFREQLRPHLKLTPFALFKWGRDSLVDRRKNLLMSLTRPTVEFNVPDMLLSHFFGFRRVDRHRPDVGSESRIKLGMAAC